MKGIYFSQIRSTNVEQGAVLKVFDEIRAFEQAGLEMRHVIAEPLSNGLRKTHIGKGICAAIPFTCIFSAYRYDESFGEYDFYYFRFEAADYPFVKFLKKLKKNNPNARILIEFPDYPNTAWMKGILYLPLLLKDLVARRFYSKYVDRFVVLNPKFKEIYDVKTINYMNGIDVLRLPVREPTVQSFRQINAIGVGTMFPVHGFERFIISMAEYYKHGGTREIFFHIVGNGPGSELRRYRRVARQTGMESRVIFEGRLIGDELTACFNKCNLAVEQLALYRKGGLSLSSSLKSREYLARGVPIISGCDIDVLMGKNFPYWKRFKNDDSLIDMNDVIEFFDLVYLGKTEKEVIGSIRCFAEKYCTYSVTLRSVIDYIKSI